MARSASSRAGLPSPRCGPGIANARGGWPRTPNVGHGRNERHGADAIVIGAGHNGLVAAARRADAGWDVLSSRPSPRPAVSSRAPNCFPGTRGDLFSAFYPLSAVSPALHAVELQDHGLR